MGRQQQRKEGIEGGIQAKLAGRKSNKQGKSKDGRQVGTNRIKIGRQAGRERRLSKRGQFEQIKNSIVLPLHGAPHWPVALRAT